MNVASFVLSVVRGLVKAEADDPAVRRAVRVLESAIVAAALVYLRSRGLPV